MADILSLGPALPLQIEILFGGLFCGVIVAVWVIFLLIAIWVYRDAESRGMSGALWLIIVILLGLIGLIVYLVVRGSHPVQPPGWQAGYGYPPTPYGPPGYQYQPQYQYSQQYPQQYAPPPAQPVAQPPPVPAAPAAGAASTCRNCGAPIAANAKFCARCGAAV